MLNVLIIEDEPNQLKNLTNILSSNFQNVKVYNISYDGESVLNTIKNCKIDILLLDLKLPGMSGVDIINFIDDQQLFKRQWI